VPGENLVIAYSFAEGKYDRLPALAADLVRLEPRVIVAVPTAAARAARDATTTIPIVMLFVSDPISEGLIASFARPGGNVTGLTLTPTRDIFAKQLQLLKEAVPRVRRIAFLWNPTNPPTTGPPIVRIVEEAARSLGVELQVVAVQAPEELEPAFRAMTQAQADALLVLIDSMFFTHRARLADLSGRHRLPAMYGAGEHAKAGGLMAYGVNFADAYRRASGYVDRLLRGANPAELAVEQPTKFDFVINLKTAKALGLTIPPSLLARADQVIE
jgi:putative ABC transport system substrate-binding protein